VETTLMHYGVNTSSVAMTIESVTGDVLPTLTWRVDVEYVGDWLPAAQNSAFVVDVNTNVRALPRPSHGNSVWQQGAPLKVERVVGLY